MTNNEELALKLKAAAEKATVLNLETAQIERGNDGYYECPVCCGLGEVEAETDFCNIDGVALGVQFYGIGEHHGAAEEYFRTVAPANVLALLAERDADKKRIGETEEVLCKLLPGVQYMDLPDGGQVEPIEQVVRMVEDYRQRIAELEARTVSVNAADVINVAEGKNNAPGRMIPIDTLGDYCAGAGIKLEVGE